MKLGFLATGCIPLVKKSRQGEASRLKGTNVTLLLLGAFMIFLGIGIIWSPISLLPYAVAGFLIFIGIWFLVRDCTNYHENEFPVHSFLETAIG